MRSRKQGSPPGRKASAEASPGMECAASPDERRKRSSGRGFTGICDVEKCTKRIFEDVGRISNRLEKKSKQIKKQGNE